MMVLSNKTKLTTLKTRLNRSRLLLLLNQRHHQRSNLEVANPSLAEVPEKGSFVANSAKDLMTLTTMEQTIRETRTKLMTKAQVVDANSLTCLPQPGFKVRIMKRKRRILSLLESSQPSEEKPTSKELVAVKTRMPRMLVEIVLMISPLRSEARVTTRERRMKRAKREKALLHVVVEEEDAVAEAGEASVLPKLSSTKTTASR